MKVPPKRSIDLKFLAARGGEYVGVVAQVTREEVSNKWKNRRETHFVLLFTDGSLLVLGDHGLAAMVAACGDETDYWGGESIRVTARPTGGLQKDGTLRMEKVLEVISRTDGDGPPGVEKPDDVKR